MAPAAILLGTPDLILAVGGGSRAELYQSQIPSSSWAEPIWPGSAPATT